VLDCARAEAALKLSRKPLDAALDRVVPALLALDQR
jgi:hypothetical protein